jgi:uncharacterized protein
MARIVLDTNVLVSAFIVADGKSGEIVQRVIAGLDELFVSQPILVELERVLVTKLGLEVLLCRSYIDLIRRYASLVVTSEHIDIIAADETDNRIFECAVEAGADFIVSGDRRHVLPIGEYGGIQILSPSEYLRQV